MFSASYSPWHALVGGVLIGLGSLIATLATGKLPGISGVVSKILRRSKGEMGWCVIFLAGLIGGALLAFALIPPAAVYRPQHSLPILGLAGLLVGFGTRLGGGCTSGHGVCGIGLGSRRGIVATLTFMAAGMVAVYVVQHLSGGPRP